MAQLDLGKITERSRLQRAIELQPDDIDARLALARFYLSNGDPRRAGVEFVQIGRLHLALGSTHEALTVCRAALSVDPENLELRMLLAQVFARMPDRSSARVAEPIDVVELTPAQRLEEVDVLEEIEVPVELGHREEVTRPPLPAAAKAAPGPTTVEVGRPAPEFEAGDVPRARGDGWPAPETITSGADAELDATVRVQVAPTRAVSGPDRAAAGDPGVGDFDRRRPASIRASSRGADAKLALGAAAGVVDPASLADNVLFRRTPIATVERLVAAGQLFGYPDSGPIVVAGKPLQSLTLLIDGGARIHDGSPAPAAPAFTNRGQLIGDFEVLAGALPRATVTAAGPARTIEIPIAAVAELRDTDPEFRDALSAALRDRVLADLFDRAPILAGVPPDQRRELTGRFFTQDVESTETVMQRGQINRRLLVVLGGQLVVDGRGGGRAFGRMTLHSGDLFGHVATVLGRPTQVTVVAAARSTLLVLAEQDVYRLVAAHKSVARAARKEAVERGEVPFSAMTVSGLGGPLTKVPT